MSNTTTTTYCYPPAPCPRMNVNTLMLTHLLRTLPTARQYAYVCSSGSQGYHALKEMLQSGIPGHTLLIESKDLRESGGISSVDEGVVVECGLVYTFLKMDTWPHTALPKSVSRITVYGNMTYLPPSFLAGNSGLILVDLSPLSHVLKIYDGFLNGCTSLTTLNLSPLAQLTKVSRYFLSGCAGLTEIDLSPLSQVVNIQHHFLAECTGLTKLDLSPLSQVVNVHDGFLSGCTGLTEIDLTPLSQVVNVHQYFLAECTGLTALDLGPLSKVPQVHWGFVGKCTGLTIIDNAPPLCVRPPYGWVSKEDTNQWIRDTTIVDEDTVYDYNY